MTEVNTKYAWIKLTKTHIKYPPKSVLGKKERVFLVFSLYYKH